MSNKYKIDSIASVKVADLFNEITRKEGNPQLEDMLGITKEEIRREIIDIALEDIREFGGEYGIHRFKTNEEKVKELALSIRSNGIINPLIVREDPLKERKYECLAGHTRMKAAEIVGLKSVPSIIKKNCSDYEALVIMAASNHQRENLSPSEKGWMYRIEYEEMKRQGKRTDLEDGNGTCGHYDHKSDRIKAIDELSSKSDDSRKQIQRYIRITHLISSLQKMVDSKEMPLVVGVELSYLREVEQSYICKIIQTEKLEITKEIACELKNKSREEPLSSDEIYKIVKSQQKEKTEKGKKYEIAETYFPEKIKKKERGEYLEKALRYIKENGIKL